MSNLLHIPSEFCKVAMLVFNARKTFDTKFAVAFMLCFHTKHHQTITNGALVATITRKIKYKLLVAVIFFHIFQNISSRKASCFSKNY
jgi:hypothetical protein